MAAGSCQPPGLWGSTLARGVATSKRPKMGDQNEEGKNIWILGLSSLLSIILHPSCWWGRWAACPAGPGPIACLAWVQWGADQWVEWMWAGLTLWFSLPRHCSVGFCWDFTEFVEHFLCSTSLLSDLADDSQGVQMLLQTGRQAGRSAVALFP